MEKDTLLRGNIKEDRIRKTNSNTFAIADKPQGLCFDDHKILSRIFKQDNICACDSRLHRD